MVKPAGDQQPTGKRFKGVRMRSWGRWVSEIRLPKSRARLWLGSYSSPERAARAYDVALRCLRGASAALNFPDSPPAFAPLGLSHRHIQKLAAASSSAYSSSSLSATQSCPPSSSCTTALSSHPSPPSSRGSDLSSRQPELSSASRSTSCEYSPQICHPHHEQSSALCFPCCSSSARDPSLSSSCDAASSLEAEDLAPTQLRDANSSPEAQGLGPTELSQNSSEVSAESVIQVPKWDFFTPLLDGTVDNFPWSFDASEWQEITMYDSLVPMEKLDDDFGRIFDPYLWSS